MNLRSWIDRFSLRPVHYLFAAILMVRFVELGQLSASPFLIPSGGDTHFYDAWAQRVLHGANQPLLAFYGLPGYAYLLAGIYWLFGYGPGIPVILQAIIDAVTGALIYKLTHFLLVSAAGARSTTNVPRDFATHLREIAGIFAGLGWALYVPAQTYAVILMPTAWVVCVFWLVVWRVVKSTAALGRFESLICGVLLGLTATAIATILVLVPLVAAAILLKTRKIDSRRLSRVAAILLLFCGVGIGTSPCWIHNYFLARDPVFLSAHSGINFWIGNNPEANGYPKFPPGLRAGQSAMLEDSIAAAESATGHPLKRSAVSEFWSQRARQYIAEHPGQWLGLLARKFRNFWSAFQYDDLSIITILRNERVTLPGLYFGVIAALAIPGMIALWRVAGAGWILAAIFLQCCALMPVFITERYRLPIVPGLLVFASAGLSIVWEAIDAARTRVVVKYIAALIVATLFVAWPQRASALWALDAYNSGRQALESKNYAVAERGLTLARAYVPDNAETNFALGNLRLAQHQAEEADRFYRETLRIDPHHKGALNNLGVLALERHDLSTARLCFETALAQDRQDARAHFLLAKTAAAAGDNAVARREIAEAVKIDPAQREFREFAATLAAGGQ